MARSPAIANGIHANGDSLPPSTLAAQIVQNQNRPTHSRQSEQQALFNSLLQEILNSPADDNETNLETNVQLIKVLVEAGLMSLAYDQPFAPEILVKQAKDSAIVIEKTIRRQPDVLSCRISQNGPPMCLWLFVKIVAIIGRRSMDHSVPQQLLQTIITTLKNLTKLWQLNAAFKQMLNETVKTLVSSIEAMTNVAAFDVSIPPISAIASFWPQSGSHIVLNPECRTQLRDASHACRLVLQLSILPHVNLSTQYDTLARMQGMILRVLQVAPESKSWTRLLHDLLKHAHPSIQLVMLQNILDAYSPQRTIPADLRVCIAVVLSEHADPHRDELKDIVGRLESEFDNASFDEQLRTSINAVLQGPDSLNDNHDDDQQEPQAKRRRLSGHTSGEATLKTALEFLSVTDGTITPLDEQITYAYSSLDLQSQYLAWQYLSDLSLTRPKSVLQSLSTLLESPQLHSHPQLRVMALRTTAACIARDEVAFPLGSSAIGRAILRGLRSSERDVRIAAGSCIPAILQRASARSESTENRHLLLQWLRQLSDQNALAVQETLIPVWGYVAVSCNENELNLVLSRLVEYLGHPNSLIRGLAFTEIQYIAMQKEAAADGVKALFDPYWSTIAVSVVQDLFQCPQKVQMLCDLLALDVTKFLTMTQAFTLPHLVATKRRDILIRIAAARGPNTSVRDICLHPRTNLIAVMSHLLSQRGADSEEFAMTCLVAADSSFNGEDLSDFVKLDSTAIACEILKIAGQRTAEAKAQIHLSFGVLSDLCERSLAQRRTHGRTSRSISPFLQRHILGILTKFSSTIESNPDNKGAGEKNLCLLATAEMIVLARGDITSALPQLRALLQSAVEQPSLCETAWSTWITLLPMLQSEDIELLIEQTFVLILRHWSAFSEELQDRTHEVVADIVREASSIVTDRVSQLPSLSSIPVFAKIGAQIDQLRSNENVENYYKALSLRLGGDNPLVIIQALKDLVLYLDTHQNSIHDAAITEQPSQNLSALTRALLDVALNLGKSNKEAAELCGKALGLIGCLDPNRIEAVRKNEHLVVLSNFEKADETVQWVIVLLEHFLVKAFKSVTNAEVQGFMAYVIQELLGFCKFNREMALRPRSTQTGPVGVAQRWQEMPENVRSILTPFLDSKYVVTTNVNQQRKPYAGFSSFSTHSAWLSAFVYDLTWKAKGENSKILFPHLARIVRNHRQIPLAIAGFIFPYLVLNIVIAGTALEADDIRQEMLTILSCTAVSNEHLEMIKLCSESLFTALDYMTVWLQEKRKLVTEIQANAFRTGVSPSDFNELRDVQQIEIVQNFLTTISVELVAKRAMECGAYSRALFNWEQHLRQTHRPVIPPPVSDLRAGNADYSRLHDIYAQIDEPDGLDGISSHLNILTEEQQATLHARSGRWIAAQAWYESKLVTERNNQELQVALLRCFQETGRYSALLKYAQSIKINSSAAFLDPYIVESAWMTNDITMLKSALQDVQGAETFGIGLGRLLLASVENRHDDCFDTLQSLRIMVTSNMTTASTASIQASHEDLKRLHLLAEAEIITRAIQSSKVNPGLISILDKRLDVLGTLNGDKQAILALRRVLLSARGAALGARYSANSWLVSARLARKESNIESAYHAVLQAAGYGTNASKLEEAKLLWHEGHRRQALYAIEQAISAGTFDKADDSQNLSTTAAPATTTKPKLKQNLIAGKAYLLEAKWLDAAGQTQVKEMTQKYLHVSSVCQKWERCHYHLAKHYNRLLEAEKTLPKTKQNPSAVGGEMTKLIVENFLRSLPFGNKYWYQTIPKLLTLWLSLGIEVLENVSRDVVENRLRALQTVHKQLRKYVDRTPAYIYYPALPQMLSRVSHPNPEVWRELLHVIIKIVSSHPAQALWSVLALTKSTDKLRQDRGKEIIAKLNSGDPGRSQDLRQLINSGLRLSNALLMACETPVENRTLVSLSKDLNFKMHLAPCGLVVPIETTLIINLPPSADAVRIRNFKPFVQDKVTIQSFQDGVLVLSSLQRPKKLTLRGSDGKLYGLLCKPKDDLRKDQRLMEFNGIINRALKRDPTGSKRRLYIKTYAVTPLSEQSGCLEWVEGIKPIRDILTGLYARRGIRPNYASIKNDLAEACKHPDNVHIFEKILGGFPPVLHEWFVEVFPEPDTWFAARLRYARSAAVMSMTGHVLGLGDRHGENILLQESTGGVFHVDFNCLFDMGLTFEKPEVVPFRLTRNMVDAMGPYGYEGPFRKSCEVTMALLRQNKDTLMTVLETFIYDPTTDFINGKKEKKKLAGVPSTPQEILDSIDAKLKGLFKGETMPLSVEGYADALIKEAVSTWNLCQMYIGWCAFL